MFSGLPGNSGHKLHSSPEQTDSTEYLLCARGFSRSWKEELTKWTKSCHGIYIPVIQGTGPKPKLPGESEARAEFWKLRGGGETRRQEGERMEGVMMSMGVGDRCNSRKWNARGQRCGAVKYCERSQLYVLYIHKTEDTPSVLMWLAVFSGRQGGYMGQNCIAG